MATDVIMPALGMAQETGVLVAWLHREGEEVAQGDPLMEVETDKAVVEVEAPASGRLAAVKAGVGDEVPVGQVMAVILAPGEEPPELPAPAAVPPPAGAAPAPAGPPPASSAGAGRAGSPQAPAAGLSPASPKARRLAAERGTRLEEIRGSGPGGAVLAADVLDLEPLVQGAPGPAAPLETGHLWRVMAERTARSWSTAPHFYLARDVDAGGLLGWRAALARQGLKVTLSDLLVRLVGAALATHPRLNVRWEDGLVALEGVDVALAVATPEGLAAPVLRGVDRLEVGQIAARRAELVDRAREGRLAPDDVGRAGFTVSNLGMYGVDAFSAILNGGQAAILAVGRIADRVVAVSGSPQVRPVMTMTLSCDHRAVDGARGAEFLQALAGLVEEPAGLVR